MLFDCRGYGFAAGGGYCKESAAAAEAIRNVALGLKWSAEEIAAFNELPGLGMNVLRSRDEEGGLHGVAQVLQGRNLEFIGRAKS